MTEQPARLQGALADRYVIERELGQGGMATVYLAHDLKHDRDVALKVLRPELAAVLGAERFLAEVKITARLDHPHILTLIDSGEAAGVLYYVLPFVHGESLRDKLAREKQLGLEDALTITRQIASALDHAHRQGVVHRDIKPENILLHEGEAMLADFGIALAVREAGGHRLTETGLSLGTPQYMSPEQATGDRNLDARSDVYSLGAVLYEMLVGEPPHTGPTVQAVIAKLLAAEPVAPWALRRTVPEAVNAAVLKALAKLPADRFATAVDFANALTAPAEAAVPEKSLVVLPFENLSPDPDNAFFADGLTEELIADLSKVSALRVISRTSAMLLKGSKKDVPTIARDLNVRYVLEGSVRRAGNSLRITAQLIDAAADAHLWAEKYTGQLEDVFEIQEKLSRTIVEALRLKLSLEEVRGIAERPIANLQAYDFYLRARQEAYHFTEESFERALRLLRNGLEVAGENTLLYALMGNIYVQYVNTLGSPNEAYLQQAEECTKRLLAIDPQSALGYWLRGALRHKRGDIQGSVVDLKHALATDPNNPDALYWLAYAYRVSGRESAARLLVQKLISIDPLTPYSYWAAGCIDFFDGHTSEAVQAFRRMHELDPDSPFGRWAYAFSLAADGRRSDAVALLHQLEADAPGTFFGRYASFFRSALQGNRKAALQASTPELAAQARIDDHWSWMMAVCYALVDEKELALEWLKTAVRLGFVNYPFLSQRDTFLEGLRGDPGFIRLMEEVRDRWGRFET